MESTILVVDDDPFYGKLLASILSHYTPYQTRVVQTGSQALQVSQEVAPILLLLDYHLPDTTGIRLYDQLHAIADWEKVPAIILSSELPNGELEEQLLSRNMMGMNKLFNIKHFLQIIDEVVMWHASSLQRRDNAH